MIEIRKESNIEDLSVCLLKALKKVANDNIPKISNQNKRITNIPPQIVELIKNKNYWWREYKKKSSLEAKDKMEILKKIVKDEIIKFKSTQWQRFSDKLGKNPLSTIPFWRRIRNKKRPETIPTILVDQKEITEDGDKAEKFAEHLENIFNDNNNERYDEHFKEEIETCIKNNKFDSNFMNKSITEFSILELKKEIKKLNNKGSIDQYGVSNKILKNVSEKFIENLLILFNMCLKQSIVPNLWKSSIITMLLKKADEKQNIKNYRPVSITPCIMRLLERLILSRLKKFLNEKNILVKHQAGFRENRQTKDNLVFLSQKIQEGFNQVKNRKKKEKSFEYIFRLSIRL